MGGIMQNYDIDLDLAEERRNTPKTPPNSSGLDWVAGRINEEDRELNKTTEEAREEIRQEWCALYGDMTESE